MGRGKQLNSEEIQTILKLKKENFTISKIAKILSRSRKVIYNLLKDVNNYGTKKSSGRPSAISTREKRAILRAASNSLLTSREIAEKVGVKTNPRNVRRVLQQSAHIKRMKLKRRPALKQIHKEHRLNFAKEHIRWNKKWRKVIFTDEKRFNLDGPDGLNFYYHDVRKKKLSQIRRQMGGGSIMLWAGIGYNGKTDLISINCKMNATTYRNLIQNQIAKYATHIAREDFIFQQDNAAVHTAKVVKEYFSKENIAVLDWPACSPDLNIIENCWSKLSKAVYRENRQFENINELKKCLEEEWRNISLDYIRKLYRSLPKRMLEVVENKGGSTHY
ncbi:Transposable element Tc3 transposase [Anthophora quadrimaculata]